MTTELQAEICEAVEKGRLKTTARLEKDQKQRQADIDRTLRHARSRVKSHKDAALRAAADGRSDYCVYPPRKFAKGTDTSLEWLAEMQRGLVEAGFRTYASRDWVSCPYVSVTWEC